MKESVTGNSLLPQQKSIGCLADAVKVSPTMLTEVRNELGDSLGMVSMRLKECVAENIVQNE